MAIYKTIPKIRQHFLAESSHKTLLISNVFRRDLKNIKFTPHEGRILTFLGWNILFKKIRPYKI